jgi:hypothetical protein
MYIKPIDKAADNLTDQDAPLSIIEIACLIGIRKQF